MLRISLLLVFLLNLNGCASMINSATQKMTGNLSQAMLNQNDLETVKAGAPAYLIMIDSLIEGDPDNVDMLIAGSKLYASYTSAFVDDEQRAQRLADKSLSYARQALCLDLHELCNNLDARQEQFESLVTQVQETDQAVLYAFASAWASWIQVNSADWNAIAQIPKLNALFTHSIRLNEAYDNGGAHLYLGVLASQIPPSLGGKPEQGRYHFEQAAHFSNNKNLMVKVLYAEYYARLVFDQDLHDRLLKEVLSANGNEPGLTLINTLAKKRGRQLLEESEEFF